MIDLPNTGHRGFRTGPLIHRNLRVYRHAWTILLASLTEPVLYLLSIGVGVGSLIGDVPGLTETGISYPQYVGAGLLATASMNAAFNETTYSAYSRLTSQNVYQAMTTTPLDPRDIAVGETLWAAMRGTLAGAGFLAVLTVFGLVRSPWAILVIPAAAVVGFAFGALGLLVLTFLRNWQDFQFIQLVMLPMFLFSTTFYPLASYPEALRFPVSCLPLYPSIELVRGLLLGRIEPHLFGSIAYLIMVGVAALMIASRRLRRLLIR